MNVMYGITSYRIICRRRRRRHTHCVLLFARSKLHCSSLSVCVRFLWFRKTTNTQIVFTLILTMQTLFPLCRQFSSARFISHTQTHNVYHENILFEFCRFFLHFGNFNLLYFAFSDFHLIFYGLWGAFFSGGS